MRLTDEQIELYSRQIILREVGGIGQAALRAARVRVAGSGAAAEICTSYLVGAGIGSVLVDADPSSPDAAVLSLPAPERRTPDASVTRVGAGSREGTDACDVLLDLDDPIIGRSRDPERALPRPRLGSILLRGNLDGRAHLLLLPRDTGCPACARVSPEAFMAANPSPGPIALASAGAVAALTCCRWILGLGDDRAAREFVFSDSDGPWTEAAGPVRISCPRGCPPPAHPV